MPNDLNKRMIYIQNKNPEANMIYRNDRQLLNYARIDLEQAYTECVMLNMFGRAEPSLSSSKNITAVAYHF